MKPVGYLVLAVAVAAVAFFYAAPYLKQEERLELRGVRVTQNDIFSPRVVRATVVNGGSAGDVYIWVSEFSVRCPKRTYVTANSQTDVSFSCKDMTTGGFSPYSNWTVKVSKTPPPEVRSNATPL